ncbi:DMT family transporter [Kibdelosporangium lantanae]|uniref:DMT family transporter n=1 Tax=Kibdelosporangium lantanae TaxID=1497396 RepID=A0ABW3M305_9PSEU
MALGLIAGAVLPIQGALNAKLRADLAAPVTVAMISFFMTTPDRVGKNSSLPGNAQNAGGVINSAASGCRRSPTRAVTEARLC